MEEKLKTHCRNKIKSYDDDVVLLPQLPLYSLYTNIRNEYLNKKKQKIQLKATRRS